jgi:hypothetical protein
MINCLLEALGLEIGLSNSKVRGYKSKIRFSMGKDQNFSQRQLMQPYLQGLLWRFKVDVLLDGLHQHLEVFGERGK